MLPELFSIGPFTFYSYGLMTAIGIIAAVCFGEYEAKKSGLAGDGFITGLGIACVIGGYASSKLLFWITILPEILANPKRLLELSSGFVVLGGLIGGILTAYFYCRVKKTDFWKTFDLLIPFVALAQCIGRIGCFLAGCCYGQPTDCAIGVVFHNSLYAPSEIRLFPIQLISSGLNLMSFLFLYIVWKKLAPKKGVVGALYIITYSTGRFFLEYYRGDLERGNVGILSTSQFISIFTVVIGIVMFMLRLKAESSDRI